MKTAIEMTREYARRIYFPEVGEFEISTATTMNNRLICLVSASAEIRNSRRMQEISNELDGVYREFQQVVNRMPGKAAHMLCPEKKQ